MSLPPVSASAEAGAEVSSPVPLSGRVVVVLKDQLSAEPANPAHRPQRMASALREQQDALRNLPGDSPRGVLHFSVGNAFIATVSTAQSAALASNSAVEAVIPDESIELNQPSLNGTMSGDALQTKPSPAFAGPPETHRPRLCPAVPARPLLEPQALGLIHAKSDDGSPSAQDLVTGSGVKVGYIADGVDPDNPDFMKPDGRHAIVDYRDFSGEGPDSTDVLGEAFGDVSAIAAQGTVIHDLHDYAPASIPAGCNVRIIGVAPGADVVALKAGTLASFPISAFLQSIDYAVNVAHVDVLNESIGTYQYPDADARNAIQLFNDEAVAAGTTVVAASGDAGSASTIGNPASDPQVISVGATTSLRLAAQLGVSGTNQRWADDNIAEFSSGGFTNAGRTIDLVAPGFSGWSACTPRFNASGRAGCLNDKAQPSDVTRFAGTSQSAPFTAGAAALVIQAYRATHDGQSPSPATVRQLITSTARDLGDDPQEQGAGLLDSRSAVEAAMAFNPTAPLPAAGAGPNLVINGGQINLLGEPGSRQRANVVITNVGLKPLTVVPTMRRFQTQEINVQHLSIPQGGTPTPIHITVPPGADQLHVRILNEMIGDLFEPAAGIFSLYSPDGTLQNLTATQGLSQYAVLSAAHPEHGMWTLKPSAATEGDVTVATDISRAASVGGVDTGRLILAAGVTRTVPVRVTIPHAGGDFAEAVALTGSNGKTSTVPVTVRTLVPIRAGRGHFAASLTGGDGRLGAPAQTFTYAFDVPAREPVLEISARIAAATPDLVEGVLIDPHGETPSVTTNGGLDATVPAFQQTVLHPLPGRWRLVIAVHAQAENIEQHFDGDIAFAASTTVRAALPDSTGIILAAGSPLRVPVRVTNHGATTLSLGIDPRTASLEHIPLTPLAVTVTSDLQARLTPTSASVTLPNPTAVRFLVPPGTREISAASRSTQPTQIQLSSPAGGISALGDLRSAQHGDLLSTADVSERTSTVTAGPWSALPHQIGPFGPQGAATGTATMSATAFTPGFDRAVTSPDASDQYLTGIDPAAPPARSFTVAPGQSKMMTVVITPTGPQGTRVHGDISLVTPTAVQTPLLVILGAPSEGIPGDVVASLPYAYTIGGKATQ